MQWMWKILVIYAFLPLFRIVCQRTVVETWHAEQKILSTETFTIKLKTEHSEKEQKLRNKQVEKYHKVHTVIFTCSNKKTKTKKENDKSSEYYPFCIFHAEQILLVTATCFAKEDMLAFHFRFAGSGRQVITIWRRFAHGVIQNVSASVNAFNSAYVSVCNCLSVFA